MSMTLDQFHVFLTVGVQNGASDIHFRAGDPPMYRVNGVLAPLKFERLRPEDTEALCHHVLDHGARHIDLSERWEFDTSYSVPGQGRFRVNMYRQRGAWAMVLRIVPTDVPTIDSLGLPAIVKTISETERGLVLVTGATGSGKTSTLAAMIQSINQSRRVHILTLEDPIEFVHTNAKASISQREIGLDTSDYHAALRAALRQDPDVILVGEMRDPESIDIALKAAETGHVVFATVHTTDAAKTIGRLVSVFKPEEQQMVRHRLADNLRATISQRLLPKTDGRGRAVAVEVLLNTQTVADHIRDADKTGGLKDVLEKGRSQYGMQSFEQHLTDLYRAGVITLETALGASSNPADFQRALSFE